MVPLPTVAGRGQRSNQWAISRWDVHLTDPQLRGRPSGRYLGRRARANGEQRVRRPCQGHASRAWGSQPLAPPAVLRIACPFHLHRVRAMEWKLLTDDVWPGALAALGGGHRSEYEFILDHLAMEAVGECIPMSRNRHPRAGREEGPRYFMPRDLQCSLSSCFWCQLSASPIQAGASFHGCLLTHTHLRATWRRPI